MGVQKHWLSLGCWQPVGRKLTSSKKEEHKAQYSLVEEVVCKMTYFHQRVLRLMRPSLVKAQPSACGLSTSEV